MMSALEGEGVMEKRMWKGRLREFYGINLIKMRTRGKGIKYSEHFADIISGCSLSANQRTACVVVHRVGSQDSATEMERNYLTAMHLLTFYPFRC